MKNAFLYYGMPLSGKSTRLIKQFIKDRGQDLCLNLWTFRHPSQHAKTATLGYIKSAHGQIRALRLPYNPYKWIPTLSAYHHWVPHIRHVLIDEAQCLDSVYLVSLVSIIRTFYPNVRVIMYSIDYDSWHHKLPRIKDLIALVPASYHLHHKCMICHRVADRRLHTIDGKPYYNEQKYVSLLRNRKFKAHHKFNMYSVCQHHYYNPPKDIEHSLRHPFHTRRTVTIRKRLGRVPKKHSMKPKHQSKAKAGSSKRK